MLMQVHVYMYVTIHMDDAFTLNCHPTVPVGCEEQVDRQCEVYQTLPSSCEGAGSQTTSLFLYKVDTQQYHCSYKLTLIVETLAKNL